MKVEKLKKQVPVHWNSPNTGATNISGFTALPAGGRSTADTFQFLGDNAQFLDFL